MDRLDEMTIFVAIIDQGSLVGAARLLRRSAPAITRALSALEDRVGVRLIERTTRQFSPTDAGRALADQARALLSDYDATLSGVAKTSIRGLLRVTAPVQFGGRHVTPLVMGFLDAHPQIAVDLVLNNSNLDLIEEGIDVGVRIGPLSDSTLLVKRVGEVRRLLVASPDYVAKRGRPRKPSELANHDTIFSTVRSGAPEWRFGPTSRRSVVRLAPRLRVSEVEARLFAARAGRGIVQVLSYQVAEDLAAGTLIRLLPKFEPPALPVQLVAPGGPHMSPKVRAFLDYAGAGLRDLRVIQRS